MIIKIDIKVINQQKKLKNPVAKEFTYIFEKCTIKLAAAITGR